jgi:hypothetical protein
MNTVTATTVAIDDGVRLTSNIMPWRTHLYIHEVAKMISIMFVRMSESYSSTYGRSNAIQAHHSLLQWRISDSSITLLIKAPPGLYLQQL